MPTGQENILRLNVPVHDAVAVSVAQRVRHRTGNPERVVQWQLLFTLQLSAEAFPVHVRHDVIEEAVGLT